MTDEHTARDIIVLTLLRHEITMSEMIGPGSRQETCRARWTAMYLIREVCQYSNGRIGRLFGGRDHSTVMHGIQRIGELAIEDGEIRGHLRSIRAALKKIET